MHHPCSSDIQCCVSLAELEGSTPCQEDESAPCTHEKSCDADPCGQRTPHIEQTRLDQLVRSSAAVLLGATSPDSSGRPGRDLLAEQEIHRPPRRLPFPDSDIPLLI